MFFKYTTGLRNPLDPRRTAFSYHCHDGHNRFFSYFGRLLFYLHFRFQSLLMTFCATTKSAKHGVTWRGGMNENYTMHIQSDSGFLLLLLFLLFLFTTITQGKKDSRLGGAGAFGVLFLYLGSARIVVERASGVFVGYTTPRNWVWELLLLLPHLSLSFFRILNHLTFSFLVSYHIQSLCWSLLIMLVLGHGLALWKNTSCSSLHNIVLFHLKYCNICLSDCLLTWIVC